MKKTFSPFFRVGVENNSWNLSKYSSLKIPVSKLPLPQRFQDMNGYFCVKILFDIPRVEFVYYCNVFEVFLPLFRFRITREILCHFLQLCTAKTTDPTRRCLRATSVRLSFSLLTIDINHEIKAKLSNASQLVMKDWPVELQPSKTYFRDM